MLRTPDWPTVEQISAMMEPALPPFYAWKQITPMFQVEHPKKDRSGRLLAHVPPALCYLDNSVFWRYGKEC